MSTARGRHHYANHLWLNLPLSGKAALVVILPVTMLCLSVLASFATQQAEERTLRLVNQAYEVNRALDGFQLGLEQTAAMLRGYWLSGDRAFLQRYAEAWEQAQQHLRRLGELQAEGVGREYLARLRAAGEQVYGLVAPYTRDLRPDAPGVRQQLAALTRRQRDLLEALRGEIAAYRQLKEREIALGQAQAERQHQTSRMVLVASLLLGLLSGVWAAQLLGRGIVQRVRVLRQNALRIARDQELLPHQPSRDELGQLAEALRQAKELIRSEQERLSVALRAGKLSLFEVEVPEQQDKLEAHADLLFRRGTIADERPSSLMDILERAHPDDRDKVMAAWNRALATKEPTDLEYRVLDFAGQPGWRSVRAQIIRNRLVGVSIDIDDRKRAEEALRRERALLQDILEYAPAMIFIKDAQGRYLMVNRAYELIDGRPRHEIVGRTDFELFPREMARAFRAHDHEVMHLGQPVEFEEADPHRIFASIKFPLRTASGEIYGLCGISTDITHRKHIEAALRDSETRFRLLAEANVAGVVMSDAEGGLSYVNQAYLDMLGYTREEFEQGSIRWTEITPPEWLPADERGIAEARRGKPSVIYEKEYLHKDGRRVPVLLALARAEIAGQERFIVTVLDLSERKKAERAREEAMALLRTTLESVEEGLIVTDLEGRAKVYNRRFLEMWGIGEEMLEGDLLRRHAFFSSQLTQPAAFRLEPTGLLADPRVEVRDTLRLKDGRVLELLSRSQQAGGEVLGRLWALRDITAQVQAAASLQAAKEEAERANRAKSEFLSRMSHELRTPMNAILGFGQLLRMEELTREQSESVEQILRAGRHLLDLINEVLDIARIEAGRMSLSIENVAMDEVVRECLDLLRPLAHARGLALDTSALEAGAASRCVLADRQRLKQVLLNLFSNAIKYNREGGRVSLSCQRRPAGRLRLSVRDTGAGIPPEKLERLFQPFDRLDAEGSGIEGTGLGLALSQRLVEAMDGRLGVESVVGVGSTFWLELPLAQAEPTGQEPPSEATPPPPAPLPGEGRTLLYIEDNLSNLRLLERLLAYRPGLQLISAMQGRLGLELARSRKPDLILLDLHLPDLAGQEVLARLKADAHTSEIPVVVLSADASPQQMHSALARGAVEFLPKPLDLERFDLVLSQVLGGVREA
ncbi:PAS domain S-box protein [Calidithermus chliarophilus]|uniref:PAS domain S-box protein n=1 Tax=Calidithermus chliarophilus TaxID=52023 RepID=UPI0004249C9D|nr:PAS domain S-box protein [Calidithermus chliarophilus]